MLDRAVTLTQKRRIPASREWQTRKRTCL